MVLAVGSWCSLVVFLPVATVTPSPTEARSEAELLGTLVPLLALTLVPVVTALLGVGAAALGLRRGTTRRVEAWSSLLIALTLLLLACGGLGQGIMSALELGPWAPAPRPTSPLTEPEVRGFGEELSRRLAAGDASLLLERIDGEVLLQRAERPARTTRQAAEFERAFQTAQAGFGRELCEALRGGGSYRVACIDLGSSPRLVMRLLLGAGSLSYHELALVRGRDGGVSIGDLLVVTTGIRWSDQLRSAPALIVDVSLSQMAELIRAGQGGAALRVYESLDEPTRRLPAALSLRVQAAGQVGPEEMRAAIRDIEALGRPELRMLLIDLHAALGDGARCEELIDELELSVRDPYLDVVRANFLASRGQGPRAFACALRARLAVPELELTWSALLVSSVLVGEHGSTREALERLSEFGHDPQGLEDLNGLDLSAFRASPEFERWRAWRADRRR